MQRYIFSVRKSLNALKSLLKQPFLLKNTPQNLIFLEKCTKQQFTQIQEKASDACQKQA